MIPFPATTAGPSDGELVILLHGFPQNRSAWAGVMGPLADEGLRAVAFDQRGYREPRTGPYRLDVLARDVLVVADALDVERFHVVGHDWGGAVAWKLAADHADRVSTMTSVATPHPAALARSMLGVQALRSVYMGLFQVPVVPERVLLARDGLLLRRALVHSGLDDEQAGEYTAAMLQPGALRAALGWYRANGVGSARAVGSSVVPTLYVWPSGDVALGRRAAELTAHHVDAAYRFEILEGAPHWVPERRPRELATLVSGFVRSPGDVLLDS